MNGRWLQTFLDTDLAAADLETGLLVLVAAFVIGHIIGWVYMWTHRGLSYSRAFVTSLVVLPAVVALVMILMSGNIVIAFGLLAVFAVVRFRNVLKDTRDTLFVLWTIVEGLAVGTMHLPTAFVGLACISAMFVYLRLTAFGARARYDAVLSLQLVGDLAGGLDRLTGVLRRHALRTQLASERRLTHEGLDLSYRLLLRDPARSAELQLELEATDGVDHVALYMREDESEF